MPRKQTATGSFAIQAATLAAAGLVVRLIGFLYRMPLTSLIGDEGNGIYATSFYIYQFFLIMSSAGLPAAISKMVSERTALGLYKSADRVFKVSLVAAGSLGLIGSLFLYFGAGWLCSLTQSPRSYMSVVALSPTVFIVAVMAVFRGYFQGQNNTVPTALSQVIEQIFNAVFSVLMAYILISSTKEGGDIFARGSAGGTIGTGVGALFGLIVLVGIYFMARPMIRKNLRRDASSNTLETDSGIAGELFGLAVPIIIGTAIFSVSNLIDLAMVRKCLSAAKVFSAEQIDALYGQLTGKYVTLTTLPVAVSTAMATAAIPSIAASKKLGDKEVVRRKINLAIRVTMIISVPAAVGMGVLADPILHMLFPKYPGGAMLLRVGSISIIFLALTQIVTGMLQATGRVNAPVFGAAFGAAVKIPLNYILIKNPDINILGAVISTIGCYIVAAAWGWYALTKTSKARPDILGGFFKPLAAAGMMGLACYIFYYVTFYLLSNNIISTITAILAGAAVYFYFLFIFNGISKEDIEMVPGVRRLGRYL